MFYLFTNYFNNINYHFSNSIFYIIKDGKFVDITVKYKDKYSIHFRDSYLMLPSSLKKLAKAFKVDDKLIFPYKFLTNYKY